MTIEKAARAVERALSEALCRVWSAPDSEDIELQDYRAAARAVLMAIREPSEAMVEAGEATEDGAGWSGKEVWQAMIDTLLQETDDGE